MQIEVQSIKSYFNFPFFTTTRLELSEITLKRNRKNHPKTEKICILYIYREYLLYLQPNASGRFLQACINFVEERLKFSHFEDSIIP